MRREIATGVLTLPAAVLFLAGCTKQSVPEPVVQTVTAGVAEQIQPDVPERYSASIEPFAQVDLAFKSGGIIEQIYQVRGADGRMRNVEAGDWVSRDTQLAQVRPLDYQHRLDSAVAQRGQSEAQLAQAQAQLVQARANFSEAEIEYTRDSNLFQSASLVKPQFDQTKGRYESLQAVVTAAEEAVKAAEAGVANARVAVTDANLSLSDTSLRAPFTGWITARNVDRGSIAGGAVIGFSMIDTHEVKAVFAVPDTSLSKIRTGQRQTVMLDALGYEAPGIVTAISPQADPGVFHRGHPRQSAGRDSARDDRVGNPRNAYARHDTRREAAACRAPERRHSLAWRSARFRGDASERTRGKTIRRIAGHRNRTDLR
jgi:multidrug efflux system membrane fusion protein